jgi:hypothetical protein
MDVYFPKELNRKIYNAYKKYSFTGDKKEVLFPLCIDANNILNLGTKMNVGRLDVVQSMPYSTKCCENGKRLGNIHTHPHEIGADDIDYFKETAVFSQTDFFGALADHVNKDTKDNVNCAMEPVEISDKREEFIVVCKRIHDVTENDLKEVVRNRQPDFTIESEMTRAYPELKAETIKLIKGFLNDYPFGKKLPESVIIGMKKDATNRIKKQIGQENGEESIVYPFPEMQHTTNIDEWVKIYKETKPMTKDEIFLGTERLQFWRKADAAAIESHLEKKGKISTASFRIVCRTLPTNRKTDEKFCNFNEKKLIFNFW